MKSLERHRWKILIITPLIAVFLGIFISKQFMEETLSSESEYSSICGNYTLGPEIAKIDGEISYLMEGKKYEEAVSLGNKYLKDDKDDKTWFCDPYFWIQRAQAFLNLGDCHQAIVAATHNQVIFPRDNDREKVAEDLLSSIIGSDICKR